MSYTHAEVADLVEVLRVALGWDDTPTDPYTDMETETLDDAATAVLEWLDTHGRLQQVTTGPVPHQCAIRTPRMAAPRTM